MLRVAAVIASLFLHTAPVAAQSCTIDFIVVVTQGVGSIRPGEELTGHASYTVEGPSFRQEGGSTAHLATGQMSIGDSISGPIWTLMITSEGPTADLIGIYANHVEGLTVAGIEFEGPMTINLFGRPGTRPDPAPPTRQEEFDRMDLRRSFSLQAHGRDMLAGNVTRLTAVCT
ncbi:hypothetical protein KUV65_12095 [Maritalea mobilis]|uniref:hypothetical protein n=1 Tax=Maritalea mobilis TaxID=483324 RepID=UPI001C950BDF|nr:hypothetical protein [Maritalea mobilis]MBY6202109.1 hypothetical protein [Maritalea mobilis]